MAESGYAATEGAGKTFHTWSRLIAAVTREDEFVIPGEFPLASYTISPAAAVTCANAGDDIAQVMAPAGLNVRVRRIRIEQGALITTAASTAFTVARVTSAGTGGTAITPSKLDNGDGAAGATAASGVPNATHGTIGAQFFVRAIFPVQTAPAAGLSMNPYWEWVQLPGMKPIIIPAGITNGLVIRNASARPGLSVNFEIDVVETAYL